MVEHPSSSQSSTTYSLNTVSSLFKFRPECCPLHPRIISLSNPKETASKVVVLRMDAPELLRMAPMGAGTNPPFLLG